MTCSAANYAKSVILNSFQDPSCLEARFVQEEEWMLKHVQHDDVGGLGQ